MAVKEESLYHATQDIILAKPRKYYHDSINTNHWQLRSLIASQQNIIYYPHGEEVIALNTKSRVREVISKIPFVPRCLTASKDWICCGGEKGKYAAIPLGGGGIATAASAGHVTDADARLPLDLDPARRSNLRDSSTYDRSSRSRPVPPKNAEVGRELVNCITLWSPDLERSEQAYDIPVAVVSNNDHSVFFLDLRDSEVLDELVLPDAVNRSVISPDGSLLASVCDDPFLYIHERMLKPRVKKGKQKSGDHTDYEWKLSGTYQLQGQRQSDTNDMRGSFAACFSKSGKHLAVATQYGIISVFECSSLKDSTFAPVVFTSSRPGPEHGAVRAMEFSPGPYDLLAWTESRGRFCVADVRNAFLSRQLTTLDPDADAMDNIVIFDRDADLEPVIDPRLRSSLESMPSSTTPDFPMIEAERRQIRQLTRVILDRYDPPPFSAEEVEVLHASQVARRQRDGVAHEADGEPTSSRWTWDEIPRSSTSSAAYYSENPREDRRISTAGLPPALREFVTLDRTASFRTYVNDRNRENDRRLRQQEPRRRNSVMLAAAENALERQVVRNESDAANHLERLTLTPRILSSDSANNPWVDADGLYRARLPADPPLGRSARIRGEIEDEQRRDFAHRLRQPWRPILSAEGFRAIPPGQNEESPLREPPSARLGETMGLSWSQDGAILYIGAAEGIYEYHVNVEARKRFPSLVLR